MEDMASKISELLSNPDGMEKIKALAGSLFGNEDSPTENKSQSVESESNGSDSGFGGFSLPDGFDIGKIMSIASLFNNSKSDKRSDLLLALKPHLSSERQQRVDSAVKLLRIVSLLPILKEQGLLDLL